MYYKEDLVKWIITELRITSSCRPSPGSEACRGKLGAQFMVIELRIFKISQLHKQIVCFYSESDLMNAGLY